MHALGNDFSHSLRALWKSPRFTLAVILTLAVGIASNSIIFNVTSAVFVHPLRYPDSSRLVYVSQSYPGFPQGGGQFSYPTYKDMLEGTHSFDSLAAYQEQGPVAITDGGQAVRMSVTYCTPNYFTLLGTGTALGRVFHVSEDRYGSGDAVVVLSFRFWQRQFSGDRQIVGRTIHLNERPFTVIGVTEEDFRDSLYEQEHGEEGNAWIPLGLAFTMTGFSSPTDRGGTTNLWAIGHLKPGVSVSDARAELAAFGKTLEQTHPDTFRGFGLVGRSLTDQLLGEFYSPAWVLAGASAFLLLIGCANVGNLLLARLLSRQRELGVRAALGASPGRLARHLLAENFLLLAFSSILGVAFASKGTSALRNWAALHLPTVVRFEARPGAILAAIGITLITGALFGVAPALVGARVDLREALSQAGRQGQSLSRRKSQKVLVVAEVALALVLLAGSGLLLESFRRLASTNLGFNTHNLLTLRLDLRSARYTEPAARARFAKTVVDTLQTLPGVDSVTLWGPSMLGRATWVFIGYPEGRQPDDASARLMMGRHSVNPGALKNLEIPLIRGREPSWQDTLDSPYVAVISESVAKKLWPGQDPVGKRMIGIRGNTPWITVIGVARDARQAQRFDVNDAAAGIRPLGLGPQYDAYFPYTQRPNQGMTLAIRTSADIAGISKEIRATVLSLDSTLPVYDLELLDQRLEAQVAPLRTMAVISSAYAVLALFLAAFGLFAVLAHDVGQRTQEIGIRMALGARPGSVLALVLREGMLLTVLGLVVGGLGALAASRLMGALLYGVSPMEPIVYVSIAVLLAGVALLACWIPARRAMLLDPLAALRQE
ncbi:MAG TPA: ABC transporter permease [Candidatus Acidoferrum sp.]|nr:ABC transporter permease [Candidatus Acidoferrum sp.]